MALYVGTLLFCLPDFLLFLMLLSDLCPTLILWCFCYAGMDGTGHLGLEGRREGGGGSVVFHNFAPAYSSAFEHVMS